VCAPLGARNGPGVRRVLHASTRRAFVRDAVAAQGGGGKKALMLAADAGHARAVAALLAGGAHGRAAAAATCADAGHARAVAALLAGGAHGHAAAAATSATALALARRRPLAALVAAGGELDSAVGGRTGARAHAAGAFLTADVRDDAP
jgi:hypothetical protein